MPPRLTLRNGLSMQDEGAWREAILEVTRAWRPFTVRLRPPEVVEDRLLSLAPIGDNVADLQDALGSSLITAGFAPRTGDVADPVLLLAGTFTGVTRSGLHELSNAVRDRIEFPDGLPRHHALHGRRGRRRQRPADRRVPRSAADCQRIARRN